MIIVIIIMITVIVIVIITKVVVLIITIIMALCSHDHVPCSPQESQHCQCSAFLVELIENHDCDQTLILITPNYCNTAATYPSAIQYKRSSLVLYRLLMLPLSGALYVTFNSVQIDFVYFIDAYVSPLECVHIVELTLASGKACKIAAKEGKRFYRQSCSRRKVRGGDRSSQ